MKVGKKLSKSNEIQSEDYIIQKQMKAIEQAIHPRKMTKELKSSIIGAAQKESFQICLIEDYERSPSSVAYSKKTTLLYLSLYLLFANKKLSVSLSSRKIGTNKEQKSVHLIQRNDIETDLDRQYKEQFFKDRKGKCLLKLIDDKIKDSRRNQLRSKDGKAQINENIFFQLLQFKLHDIRNQNIELVLNYLCMFFSVLRSILQSSSIRIERLSLQFSLREGEQYNQNNERLLQKLGWFFWQFVRDFKDIQSIDIKVPNLVNFLHPIKTLFSNQTDKLKSSENQADYHFEESFLENVTRLQVEDILTDKDSTTIDSTLILALLEIVPNLKVLIFRINSEEIMEDDKVIDMKNSYQIFKTISTSNIFIESLFFSGFKLAYESTNPVEIENQKVEQNGSVNNNEYIQVEIDKNLFQLQKMQESCPYLCGVVIDFVQKAKNEERRLQQKQRQRYVKTIEKTRQIMNLFYRRGMNNQRYFNTIKILEAQGFDYETILGVLDKLDPFSPI